MGDTVLKLQWGLLVKSQEVMRRGEGKPKSANGVFEPTGREDNWSRNAQGTLPSGVTSLLTRDVRSGGVR